MNTKNSSGNFDTRTILVYDDKGKCLLCFLEHRIPLDEKSYALLTPVDTPVCLFRFHGENDPELIDIDNNSDSELILSIAEVVLEEYDLILVRSAVSLTVNGELDECERDDLEEDSDTDDESETYELLISFMVKNEEYGLYIPLDPFFIVACIEDNVARLVEGEEFDRIQARIEIELSQRGLLN